MSGGETCLLVGQRCAQRLIGAKPLRLKLSREVLDICLRLGIEISHRRLKADIGTKLLDTKLSREVLLRTGDIYTLIGQRRLHGVIRAHTLSLELRSLIVNRSLLLVRQVGQCRLHTSADPQLLLLKSRLKVLLPSGHSRCAVTLKLLLSILVCRLHATRLDISKLLAEITLALHGSEKLAATPISALPCCT